MEKYLGNVYGKEIKGQEDNISPMCFCIVEGCFGDACGVN